ncbi:MAG: HlyD family efflux transporter periplasmic adaptor subunit [Roseburia sp.]
MARKKSNIIKYRKPFHLNIGIIVFAIIFIYICFYVFSYMTRRQIGLYEVKQGTIAENNTYQALALRDETVYYSDYAGTLDYYMNEGAKIAAGDLVYSVDETGEIASQMAAVDSDELDLNSSYFKELKSHVEQYSQSYSTTNFYQVYDFKNQVDSLITEAVNQSTLSNVSDYVDNTSGSFHRAYSAQPGVIAYYVDGYEEMTVDSFSPDLIQPLDYTKTTIKNNSEVAVGDVAYKLVTSETWNLIFKISEDTKKQLEDDTVIEIRFTKDGTSCWVYYEIRQIGSDYYMILSLNNHMIRFLEDRYVEIELLLEEQSGLKIPSSAIVYNDFYLVPKEYFTKGGDSNEWGVYVQNPETREITFIETEIYNKTEDSYYISTSLLDSGTLLQKPDSTETFTLSETAQLEGVYNINKGYAVFKRIEILYQNEEYAIVKTGTSYGLALYDHIALEGDAISENELINNTR